MLRRNLSLALILGLLLTALALAGCGDDSTANDGVSKDSSSGESSADAGDADAIEQLEDLFGDTDWYAAADRIEIVTKLRHPVWEVHLAATVAEIRGTEWMNEIHQALYDVGEDSFHLDVYGTDGPAGGSGSGSEESVELPAPPASIDEMASWMDSAYGPASGAGVEEWYGHITGYDFEADAWDGANVLVVKTDLVDVGFEWSPEREIVDLIGHAVATSEASWAENVRIEDASEENLSTGDMRPDIVPYRGY